MGNCIITRRNYSSGGGGGGESLPAGYVQLQYVNCGSGSNRQSGFTIWNCLRIYNGDIVEIITTKPSFVSSEAAIFGRSDGGYEIYYDSSFNIQDYGGYFNISNTSEEIESGIIKNTTIATAISGTTYCPNIGYYRSGSYPYVGRLYSCQIRRPIKDALNTTTGQYKILHNLIPCVRTSDSTVGMFDLIYQVFYPAVVGDPFTAPT